MSRKTILDKRIASERRKQRMDPVRKKLRIDSGYLRALGERPDGEKCEHKKEGRWVLKFEGSLWGFYPATQLQKDIWLGDENSDGYAERLEALRWYCNECGTVQLP